MRQSAIVELGRVGQSTSRQDPTVLFLIKSCAEAVFARKVAENSKRLGLESMVD